MGAVQVFLLDQAAKELQQDMFEFICHIWHCASCDVIISDEAILCSPNLSMFRKVYHEVQPLKLWFHLLNTHIYLVFYSRSRETLAYGATMESNVTNSKVKFFYLQFSTMMWPIQSWEQYCILHTYVIMTSRVTKQTYHSNHYSLKAVNVVLTWKHFRNPGAGGDL